MDWWNHQIVHEAWYYVSAWWGRTDGLYARPWLLAGCFSCTSVKGHFNADDFFDWLNNQLLLAADQRSQGCLMIIIMDKPFYSYQLASRRFCWVSWSSCVLPASIFTLILILFLFSIMDPAPLWTTLYDIPMTALVAFCIKPLFKVSVINLQDSSFGTQHGVYISNK